MASLSVFGQLALDLVVADVIIDIPSDNPLGMTKESFFGNASEGEQGMTVEGQNDGKQSFPFKVNGIEIVAATQEVLARDILELAKQVGAMPGNPEEYILQGDKGQYEPNDFVDLDQDNIFITIRNAPTQVA